MLACLPLMKSPLFILLLLATLHRPATSLAPPRWRVAVNFGRESGSPRSFAASGARFPLKFELAFEDDGSCVPSKPLVEYTDFGGSVTRPVSGGEWEREGQLLRFWLDFPEEFGRGDIIVPAGRVYFAGQLWTAAQLNAADQEYFAARSR